MSGRRALDGLGRAGDLGWFVIDNLPLELVVRVGDLTSEGSSDYPGVAFIVGRSGGVSPEALLAVERELQQRHDSAKISFSMRPTTCSSCVFEGIGAAIPSPARRWPHSIAGERALLSSIRDAADLVIDTGSINANQLRRRIAETFTDSDSTESLRVSLVSFGLHLRHSPRRGSRVRLPISTQPSLD